MTKARDLSQVPNASLGFKNRIINGDMRIDQRNNGASVSISTGAATYTVDRWSASASGGGVFNAQRTTSAPAGFTNSFGLTVTTVDSSIASNDYYIVEQQIEGFNVADLAWGTANAAPVTLSFWVRSSLTGLASGRLCNAALNRSYVFTYTVNAANTWEYKTVTIAGDTTGTWLTDNSRGMSVTFNLTSGSGFTTSTIGAWTAGNLHGASTQTLNFIGTNGATWQITGVQLEKGSTATSFDYRPYGTELALCQRYYQTFIGGQYLHSASGAASSSTNINYFKPFIVEMRAVPTFTFSGQFWADGTTYIGHSNLVVDYSSTLGCRIAGAVSGANLGQGYGLTHNSTNARLNFSSEL